MSNATFDAPLVASTPCARPDIPGALLIASSPRMVRRNVCECLGIAGSKRQAVVLRAERLLTGKGRLPTILRHKLDLSTKLWNPPCPRGPNFYFDDSARGAGWK
jgi:hypothetical protein